MTGIRHHYTQFITEELAIHITYYNKQFSLCRQLIACNKLQKYLSTDT